MNSPPRICVIGSINMDLVVRCDRLPAPGETVLADSSTEVCGGKGANQAVAAAKAGGAVSMVGRVGDDLFAERLVNNLKTHGIDCTAVTETANCSSGLAIVGVEASGQNAIMVVSGANGCVSRDDVKNARSLIEASDLLLLQMEIPVETALAAIALAKEIGVKVILDPAPAPQVCPGALFGVDLLCPNESEAAALTGLKVDSFDEAEAAARKLHQRGARNVIITMGERGSLLFDGQQAMRVESFPIEAVDTTAAGDAFAGALAVEWSRGIALDQAVLFANAAGALSASRAGAQPGMPTRDEIETLWRSGS